MDDLERLFERLVEVLAREDPSRLRMPFQVSELYQSIIPYRRYRNQLQFDTNQDYEMAVLRLLAGEGGYLTVEPREVQQQLAEEVQAINPNPGVFREFAAARVVLNTEAIRNLMSTSDSYAPPAGMADKTPEGAARYAPAPRVTPSTAQLQPSTESAETPPKLRPQAGADRCPQCSATLPHDREVSFCPFCGDRVRVTHCPRCGCDIEPRWRFCADCGAPAGDG
ncbi:MAG: zinc ribbon domain-containing protein [Gemmatimonadota bacterium]|nr:MAG: zinc ribbon domain-containing protein [Gemmatimonadota bacterium]